VDLYRLRIGFGDESNGEKGRLRTVNAGFPADGDEEARLKAEDIKKRKFRLVLKKRPTATVARTELWKQISFP